MRNNFVFRFFISFFLLLACCLPATAQSAAAGTGGGIKYFMYVIAGFALLAIILTAYFISLNNKFQREYNIKKGRLNEPTGFGRWWAYMDKKFFTRAASLEQEADVLLDHDYDGIKELDNALPPWWKWGFYITIIIGVIYLFRFHVFNTGPTPEDEYNKEMQVAAAKLVNLKGSKDMINESNVTLADASGVAAGKKIFTGICFACHGPNGEGNAVGPNLTDKYWLHGGSLSNIFKTITNGVPDKGMQSWSKTFSPTDIKNLASFILSLQGTNPPNAKAPQGNLYEPGKNPDSANAKKDTLVKQPVK
jgi:cytochrome c oxidase cbb3-type subunit 3